MDLNCYIKDMEDYIQKGRIKILPLYNNSKAPVGNDYYNKNYTLDDLRKHNGNFWIIVGANHQDSPLAIIDVDGYKLSAWRIHNFTAYFIT